MLKAEKGGGVVWGWDVWRKERKMRGREGTGRRRTLAKRTISKSVLFAFKVGLVGPFRERRHIFSRCSTPYLHDLHAVSSFAVLSPFQLCGNPWNVFAPCIFEWLRVIMAYTFRENMIYKTFNCECV